MPLAASGYVAAAVLGFAHTLGEFGVVLMIGGNIPGRTQVLSSPINERGEQHHNHTPHRNTRTQKAFSCVVLVALYASRRSRALVQP